MTSSGFIASSLVGSGDPAMVRVGLATANGGDLVCAQAAARLQWHEWADYSDIPPPPQSPGQRYSFNAALTSTGDLWLSFLSRVRPARYNGCFGQPSRF